MHQSQANRARIAERVAARLPGDPRNLPRPNNTPGTNPALRSPMPAHPMAAGVVRRTRCAPLTPMQRDSTGARSAWAASPYYFTDPKWSATVSEVRA